VGDAGQKPVRNTQDPRRITKSPASYTGPSIVALIWGEISISALVQAIWEYKRFGQAP
jgi:hypothetical protein